MKSGVYKLTNLVNNKIYIGQARDLENRKSCHKTKKNNSLISRAIFKYGWINFSWKILEFCEFDVLDKREKFYIEQFKSWDLKIGYNLLRDVNINPMLGRNHSPETKLLLSQIAKSKNRTGTNNHFYGKHHSEETKKIMSEIKKKNYLGESNPFYGKKHTEETKLKISLARKSRNE